MVNKNNNPKVHSRMFKASLGSRTYFNMIEISHVNFYSLLSMSLVYGFDRRSHDFSRLKTYRAVANRFDKCKKSYENRVALDRTYLSLVKTLGGVSKSMLRN